MKKIKLIGYSIEDLPYYQENDPNENPYKDFYHGVELLQLVHKMSHIILKKPVETSRDVYVPSDWHICHQFAFFYNHGCLLNNQNFFKRVPHEAIVEFGHIAGKDDNRENYEILNQILEHQGEICRKYFKPEQDKLLKSYKERFFTPQIIASLCAFNINVDQFWYMFLFTIDYIYRKTHNVTDYYPTALDSFKELYSITSGIPKYNPRDISKIDTSLVLKFGKRKLRIENANTIKLLGDIIHQFCEKHRNECNEELPLCSKEWADLNCRHEKKRMTIGQVFGLEEFHDWRNIKTLTATYLFREYMKLFFKGLKGIRNRDIDDFVEDAGNDAKTAASIDVELLISRLAWAAHYIVKANIPNDKDYLKSALKKFKPDENLARGDYFWTIGIY